MKEITITLIGEKESKLYETSYSFTDKDLERLELKEKKIKFIRWGINNATQALRRDKVEPTLFIIWECIDFGKYKELTPELILEHYEESRKKNRYDTRTD